MKDTKGRDLIEGAWYAVFGTDAYDCRHESLVEWSGTEFVTEEGEPDDGYEFDYRNGLRAPWETAVLQHCKAATTAGVSP